MPNYAPKLPLDYNQSYGPYTSLNDLKDLARQNLKMLILTNPGERIMIPSFGVGIRRFLFENRGAATSANIKSAIQRQVSTYLPYISINEIFISDLVSTIPNDFYENALQVSIRYTIPSAYLVDEFQILLNISQEG